MVTTSMPTPSFEAYYNHKPNTATKTQNGVDTSTVVLITGLVLVSALTVYFAIENFNLKKNIKPRIVKDK